MGETKNRKTLPEWARRIESLRKRLKISQGELARRMQCSAMTISRWERGLLAPSSDHYVQLGKLSNKQDCWFFWERAGIQVADVVRALPERVMAKLPAPQLEAAHAGVSAMDRESKRMIAVPMLKAVAGSHGTHGDRKLGLGVVDASRIMGAPADWCPNPRYTSLLRVRGHSMQPLIPDGAIVAVDSFDTDGMNLDGKIVVVTNDEKGICVSRLRRYAELQVLEPENREYEPIVVDREHDWRILGRVLWWISPAP